MPEKYAYFAERLKALRERDDITQYTLSKRTGLSKQTIWYLETGKSEPSWTTIQLLAIVFKVSTDAFIDHDLRLPEEEPPKKRGRPRKDQTSLFDVEEPATTKKTKRTTKTAAKKKGGK